MIVLLAHVIQTTTTAVAGGLSSDAVDEVGIRGCLRIWEACDNWIGLGASGKLGSLSVASVAAAWQSCGGDYEAVAV